MKNFACLLSLIMLFVSLSGCAGSEDDCCEDLDRNTIASDTVTIEPDRIAFVTIKDFEDSQESYARELMKSPYYGNDPDCDIHPAGEGGCEGENLTFEEALEAIGDLKLEGLRRLGFLGIGEKPLAPQVPQDVPFPFRPSFSLTTLIFVP